uniref:LRRCT domain-containing protein n=1 Tax=Heterorhabditis bacteriophora TaxID=37862 RepID=A0A1I7XD02_HETBA
MINMNNSSRLYELHPNAFGWQNPESDRVYSLKYLHIENCNISLITEDLLDWDLVSDNCKAIILLILKMYFNIHMQNQYTPYCRSLTELRIGGNPINCSCETAFLMEGEIYSYEYSNSLPKCYYPKELRGRPLVKVQQVEACSGIQTAQRSTRFARVLMILLVLVFISVTMYYMIISGRLKALFQKVQYPQVSYSNLANKDDQQSLEHDFQPRPQDV